MVKLLGVLLILLSGLFLTVPPVLADCQTTKIEQLGLSYTKTVCVNTGSVIARNSSTIIVNGGNEGKRMVVINIVIARNH